MTNAALPFRRPTHGVGGEALSQFRSEEFIRATETRQHNTRATQPPTAQIWWSLWSDRTEIVAGRILAACIHPFAAWRILSISWKLVILAAYVVVGYLTVLSGLLVVG